MKLLMLLVVTVKPHPFEKARLRGLEIMELEYEGDLTKSDSEQLSCVGLLSHITSAVAEHATIWQCSNRSEHSEETMERGRMEFVIEMTAAHAAREREQQIEAALRKPVVYASPDLWVLKPPKWRRLGDLRIFLSLKAAGARRETIIRMCKEEGVDLGILDEDFVVVAEATRPAPAAVVDGLKDSNGMLQFYLSDECVRNPDTDFTWLHCEFFGALLAGKPCVRLIDGEWLSA